MRSLGSRDVSGEKTNNGIVSRVLRAIVEDMRSVLELWAGFIRIIIFFGVLLLPILLLVWLIEYFGSSP